MDVESVSDELYGLPLDEFTPVRGEREKQAKAAGEKDLAAQIHQLAKPNLVAWLANQLARQRANEIGTLLALGTALREATAQGSGEQLRELSRQQHQVVYAFVQQARGLASAAGRKISQDTARALEDTLRAALADPDAAGALAAGRLTEGMQNSGFGGLTGLGSAGSPSGRPAHPAKEPAPAAAPSPRPSKSDAAEHRASEQRERAESVVEQASSAADEATAARQEAQTQLDATGQAVADAGSRVERARRELDEAMQAQLSAKKDQRVAQTALDRADRSARDARRRLADATERLNRLVQG